MRDITRKIVRIKKHINNFNTLLGPDFLSSGLYRAADIAETLGEVVIGKKKRAGPDTITIFDSTGLAIQEIAIAKIAMQHGKTIELPFP